MYGLVYCLAVFFCDAALSDDFLDVYGHLFRLSMRFLYLLVWQCVPSLV